VHSDVVNESSPSKPTVDEAKAARKRSPALSNIVRVLRVLASLSKKLDSVLENTPLATPLKVINEIVDVVEARHTGSSSCVSRTQTETSYRTWWMSTKPPRPRYAISASVWRRSWMRFSKLVIVNRGRRLRLLRGAFNPSSAALILISVLDA
jgi:hypothetical protein